MQPVFLEGSVVTERSSEEDGPDLLHFLTGIVAGGVALFIFWLLGLPDIFQILWGAAVSVLVWWHFDPGVDGPRIPEVIGRD